ncbi:LysR family transcriptional regulator [Burkholderia gladioli]|jgi:DNA-binding transcriptional LysR family regulator|uniref:LysR family transcriptional regulator n=1 Tax=Burkholderia gladioli TaxID=28095 RepID=UPI002445EDEB|nr:LysR family transcriptional regulator [Burkholderia gladioli]
MTLAPAGILAGATPLNPQWLRTFEMLVETGNFTRAAERLGLTQAAVSQHLRHLEDQLGLLVIRRPRGIDITPTGRVVLDYCADLARADQRLRSRLAEADADCGEISLITPGSIGLVMAPWLLDMQLATPGLVVRHRFAPDREVLDAVLSNLYEVGLVTLKPDDERLAVSRFAEEPLELVVPADDYVSNWADLERLGFVDHPDGLAMASRLLSRRFPDNPGVRGLPRRAFTNQVGLILEPVARGLGFTVIPRYARQAFARQEAIRVIECGASVVDTLWLIHRSEWTLSGRMLRAVEALRHRLHTTCPCPEPGRTAARLAGEKGSDRAATLE